MIADQSVAESGVTEREYLLDTGQQEHRVLVVDDSFENRELLQRLLHKPGFN